MCSKGATRLDRFCRATCPSGCTTCSKGATRWLDELVDSKPLESTLRLIARPLESSRATVVVCPHGIVDPLELGNR